MTLVFTRQSSRLILPAIAVIALAWQFGCTHTAARAQYRRHLGSVIQPVADDQRTDVLVAFGRKIPTSNPARPAPGGSATDPATTLHAEVLSAYDRGLPPPPMP